MNNYPALPPSSSAGFSTDPNKQVTKLSARVNSANQNKKYAIEQFSSGTSNQITKLNDGNSTVPSKEYAIEQSSSEGPVAKPCTYIYSNEKTPNVGHTIRKSVDFKKSDDEQSMEAWKPLVEHSRSSGGMLEDGIQVNGGDLVYKNTTYDSSYDGNSDSGKKTCATEISFESAKVGKRKMRGDIEQGGRDCAYDLRGCLYHTIWLLALVLLVSIGGFAYYFIQFQHNQSEIQRLEAHIAQLNSTVLKCDIVSDTCAPLRAANDYLSESNTQLNGTVTELQIENQNLLTEVDRLHNQLDQLLANIEGLDGDVNGLLDNLDDYQELNSELNEAVEELERQNQLLNNSNTWYADLNSQFNESIADLQSNITYLEQQNQIYAGLNNDLNATAARLSGEVDRLENATTILGEENENLSNSVDSLSNEVDELTTINNQLGNSIIDLKSQVDRLTSEIDSLESINGDLENVVSFLNETANDFDETFEAIASFLSEQIIAYRAVLMETLQNTYSQRIASWDCAYRDMFRLEEFVNNDRLPIGAGSYPEVIEYVDERVLSELCLSISDFEMYLDNRWVQQGVQPPVSATTNDLVVSVQLYTMAAMNYYFSEDEADGGLSKADWAEASYDCENLPLEKRFSM